MATSIYTDAYIEHGCAYSAAIQADRDWQRELDFQDIDRYSLEARGEPASGSTLRSLYERKLRADEELQAATDRLRIDGTLSEIQAVEELYGDE